MVPVNREFPRMARMRQHLDDTAVQDVPGAVISELRRVGADRRLLPGQSVAVTGGSRGIAGIAVVLKAVVDFCKNVGTEPFLFAAMGSHGGATADGQRQVLNNLGITEARIGCPVRSAMEVDEIGRSEEGLPVYVDRAARRADHVIVVNRVKPHTKFEGRIGSGLLKMMAVGMGKQEGARCCHRAAVRFGMERVIVSAAKVVMRQAPVLCGLGIVENGRDGIAGLRAVACGDILSEEPDLLAEARRRMARIPFGEIDLLVVDEIGKNLSGTGMDTNVTGVNRDILGVFRQGPRTRRLFVRDLTPETAGNALGIGFADVTTTRLVQKIDREKTTVNCLAGISPEKGAIPIHFDTDRECVAAAIQCLGMIAAEEIRVVHIRNTRSLEFLSVSEAYRPEIEKNPDLAIQDDWAPMAFGPDGRLRSPFDRA